MKKEDGMKNNENKLYEKIAEVVSFVCRNPLVFVSETDIHALMMSALMGIECFNPYDKGIGLYDTEQSAGPSTSNIGGKSPKKYKTTLIHKEYGHNEIPWARSDIVIFDEEDVKKISDPKNLKGKHGYLTPKYIFEFGTEKSGSSNEVYREHLKTDFKKLSQCKKEGKGFLIHIHRNHVQSKSVKVKDRNKNKLSDYRKTTYKEWNKVKGKEWKNVESKKDGEWKKVEGKDKFKVLIFIINIEATRDKVTMFYPYTESKKVEGCWKGVEIDEEKKEIEKKIMENLLKK